MELRPEFPATAAAVLVEHDLQGLVSARAATGAIVMMHLGVKTGVLGPETSDYIDSTVSQFVHPVREESSRSQRKSLGFLSFGSDKPEKLVELKIFDPGGHEGLSFWGNIGATSDVRSRKTATDAE